MKSPTKHPNPKLQLTRYGVAKWHKNSNSMKNFEVQYFHTLAPNVVTGRSSGYMHFLK